VDFCPRCGDANIRLFSDRSGWCMRCNMPFKQAASRITDEPDRRLMADGQFQKPASAHAGDGQSPSRLTPAPQAGQVFYGIQYQAGYWVPIGMPTGDQWREMEKAKRAQAEWLAEEMKKAAGILMYIGSGLALAAVALSFIMPPGPLGPYGGLISSKINLCFCGAASLELLLGALAIGAGFFFKDSPVRHAIIAIVAGVILMILSLLLIGGLLGAIGGTFVFVGGLMGLSI
jgi:hypothetical protein